MKNAGAKAEKKRFYVGVTGAAGYIGAALIPHLQSLDCRIRALDRFSHGVPLPPWSLDVELYDMDLREPGPQLDRFVRGLDFVFDLAAIPDVNDCEDDPARCLINNAVCRVNFLKAMIKQNVRGYLIPSSVAAVYGEPITLPIRESHPAQPVNMYGLSKLWSEEAVFALARSHPLQAIIVRQSNVYGPSPVFRPSGVIHRFLDNALHRRPLRIYGTGEQCRDFIYIEDLLNAYIRLMRGFGDEETGVKIYNVAGSVSSILALAEECVAAATEVTGSKVPIRHEPARNEAAAKLLDVSTEQLALALGEWQPTSLKQGIERTLAYMLRKE